MVDVTTGSKGGKWVCPNDRQLALRAKLSTGWSVKTQDLHEYGRKSQSLDEMEQNVIKQVIKRAEILDQREQERVGRLVDRLDNMKRNIMGNGTTQCILCGDTFRLFGTSNFLCYGCKKLVCEKCGIEILSSNQEPLWLCKICSETREMWKKSGAWFFKGLPKYKLPEKKTEKYGIRRISRPGIEKNNWSKSVADLSETSNKFDSAEEVEDSQGKSEERRSHCGKSSRTVEELGRNPIRTSSSSMNSMQNEKISRDGTTGSGFFKNGGGIAEPREEYSDKKSIGKDRSQEERSTESSESICSSFSRQTSSTFSDSQQSALLSASQNYFSPVNQSYDRLSINSERNKSDSSLSNCDKSPTTTTTSRSSSIKLTGGFEKLNAFSKSPQEKKIPFSAFEKISPVQEGTGKRGSKSMASSQPNVFHRNLPESNTQPRNQHRKKVSIDFGKATSFLRYPMKSERKKEKNSLNKFSSSESHLESSSDNGSDRRTEKSESAEEFLSENCDRLEIQSGLEANHWMSQESSIHTLDSLSDLNFQLKWSRRESLTSLSRDYWSEDQLSLSSSMGVNQEDSTEAVGGKNSQLGILDISLWYDPTRAALHCTLHRGKGLRPTDINGLADPFCKLHIEPPTNDGKSVRLKTKTVHKSINPEFNETVNFYGITETDVQKKTLHILVLDDDKYGNDILGEARIPLFKIGAKQTKHISVFLEKSYRVEEENEVWGEENWNRGKILLTLCYSTKKRALIVMVGRCTNLLPMDNNGLSDPFVKLHLNPDPNHKKYKTSIKWKDLNPIFNEEFVFETKMTDLPKQTLILTIWDKDYGKSNDYLGGLELGWKSKGERLKHWIDVIKFPDHKHEGWHRLGENLITD